ncbi:MAG: family 20 glycosylhydrolase [Bacteroidales bacterium]|mgnify:CR=1 FL=1|nr:family 20 glycosylhydrolase [Bacteroidales bacterium]MDD4385509.1 family 20 glycosylhydrolase [Bacteroidales bacterium]MDY0198789.1 family 20 glycosylhydrolase [Tenuifilaceae bacterium]
MSLKKIISIGVIATLILASCAKSNDQISIIPQPVKVEAQKGKFAFTPTTQIVFADSQLEFIAGYAASLWEPYLGYEVEAKKSDNFTGQNTIVLKIGEIETDNDEGYALKVTKDNIEITANTPAGVHYGVQTLYQLISSANNATVTCVDITDFPRFVHRGMHLDVSRHYMPIEFIYKMIDYMALHKLNRFHWHLTDDQGWRLEIKKYPKLTRVGAWRVDMEDSNWNDRPLVNDPENATYGGFYTQEQVREVVKYAAQRNITIMPEIEMPAHAMAALAGYPELSCTGENLGTPPGGVWPITHIFCAGNDKVFDFIEDVLTEVMDLFPSQYIHIGGDEADKTNWEKCPKCQKRIKKEGLKDEAELQSYFIHRIETFLNKHNRILVGWDEILEGGLAPNATVMSWRGDEGGIEAAKQGNTAIMSPGTHCYFDHYQGDPALEPLTIGGFTPLKKVYAYEPIPEGLTPEQERLILGAQANHWTEYMTSPQHVEYMAFPRLAALSEVLWSPKELRNWPDFCERMTNQYARYQKLGVNYSHSAFQVSVTSNIDSINRNLILELSTEAHNSEIRYTLNGEEPNAHSKIYKKPITLKNTTTLKAVTFKNGEAMGKARANHYNIHKAFAADIDLLNPSHSRYDGKSNLTLVNGIEGSISHTDGNWKGFLGKDMVATIDLRKAKSIERISVDAMQNTVSWIFFPQEAIFEVSTDGNEYTVIGQELAPELPIKGGKIIHKFSCEKQVDNIQFARITLKNLGTCPVGHSGEGNPAFLFSSEIAVE